ncbi:response regulator [Aliishimia ponticola]|uniref:Response regulator n=1 Tax=Aliishimia ponticola TaxID=2499833 RepID=A0A4S4NC62_9RHOB|nr:response regulator [Aliishimia ponticola]THH35638.1 response regulator [Aliishimia ponticola]
MLEADQCVPNVSILIVEDQVVISMALSDVLTSIGCKDVELATTVQDAFHKVASRPFDIAVLDLRLPDGSPQELAAMLKEAGTGLIFHSGHALSSELLKEFPDAVVCRKPCPPQTFVDAILDLKAD